MNIYLKHYVSTAKRLLSDSDIASIFLEMNGGGYDVESTASAMIEQSKAMEILRANEIYDLKKDFYLESA